MEYNLRTVRIGDDVWEQVQKSELSVNALLRLALGMTPRKVSRRQAHAEALRAADPVAEAVGREDIEHGNMELPSSGSVGLVGAAIPMRREQRLGNDSYRARGIRPKGDKTR